MNHSFSVVRTLMVRWLVGYFGHALLQELTPPVLAIHMLLRIPRKIYRDRLQVFAINIIV